MLKIWPNVKVMTWPEKGNVAYQSIRIVALYQKLLPKYCWWLFMTFSDFWPVSWGGVTGHNFRFRESILPVTRRLRVLRMVFVHKRCLSIFSHFLLMERSQNWPDLRPPISKFWVINFIDTVVTGINCWKFQDNRSVAVGVAMTSIQTFDEVKSLNVTWWPDLDWPRFEISTSYAKRWMNIEQVC